VVVKVSFKSLGILRLLLKRKNEFSRAQNWEIYRLLETALNNCVARYIGVSLDLNFYHAATELNRGDRGKTEQ
jgi:hypothetical protein